MIIIVSISIPIIVPTAIIITTCVAEPIIALTVCSALLTTIVVFIPATLSILSLVAMPALAESRLFAGIPPALLKASAFLLSLLARTLAHGFLMCKPFIGESCGIASND